MMKIKLAAIVVAIWSVVLFANDCADDPDCKYHYNSVSDRIQKEARVFPPDPAGEIRERIKIDPIQDVYDRVYGKEENNE